MKNRGATWEINKSSGGKVVQMKVKGVIWDNGKKSEGVSEI